jgi:hypothetical protein
MQREGIGLMTNTKVLIVSNAFLKWYGKQRSQNEPITMFDTWLRTWRYHYKITDHEEHEARETILANLPDMEHAPTPTPSGQNDMFGAPSHGAYGGFPPFVRGSDTSQAAAASIMPRHGSMKRMVLDLFTKEGTRGLTDNEIELQLHLRHQSASARRRELELDDLIVRTERKRLTDSGRHARVYVLKEHHEAR